MPFEQTSPVGRKIAVIGGGISGMGAAYELANDHHVVLFEEENRLGGHARTRMAGKNGDQPVDTGFIVFNHVNYPNMVRLFEKLDVPTVKSDMSFGASINGGELEYGFSTLNALFGQRRNVFSPKYWGMVRDVLRFNAQASDAADQLEGASIGELLDHLKLGDWFRRYYLAPLSGAIWSTPTDKIMDFPAHAFISFFKNHALLSHTGQHQWYTVKGGSIQYVTRLQTALTRKGVDLRLGAPVEGVMRTPYGPKIRTKGGEWEQFDEVVFATHSDISLRLLSDPSEAEHAALSAIRYQPNDVILHADTSVMPKRRSCWASWVYTEDKDSPSDRIDLTYWMNNLQPIPQDDPHFVTLNTRRTIRQELIYDQVTLWHPVYDDAALLGQEQVRQMNGTNNTWFCGAWMKNGFHEDGLSSGLDVAEGVRSRLRQPVAAE
ncbi:FAD-dependent oxidoreductase [Donghicola sp. C2-DW-16]|uniref:FAD-dependent oxidoreductase n=1 Tax=Donghicola mangrovi TaxID=2729614 RepID=A0ABX2P8M4_9RHOB|nr:FAD-dependent oxidoreductase [Donghicola mangrovi]NVO25811.1 FAD-dependent oxidoreductase [Donghicola mangrovi]